MIKFCAIQQPISQWSQNTCYNWQCSLIQVLLTLQTLSLLKRIIKTLYTTHFTVSRDSTDFINRNFPWIPLIPSVGINLIHVFYSLPMIVLKIAGKFTQATFFSFFNLFTNAVQVYHKDVPILMNYHFLGCNYPLRCEYVPTMDRIITITSLHWDFYLQRLQKPFTEAACC